MPPFHLAFAVHDLDQARQFYVDQLGCRIGRTSTSWIDFEFFGHQLSAHLDEDRIASAEGSAAGRVDGDSVPIPHFGVVLDWSDWHQLADRLRTADAKFCLEPRVRYAGEAAEQATMFLFDPSGNALEFKAMKHPDELFEADASATEPTPLS